MHDQALLLLARLAFFLIDWQAPCNSWLAWLTNWVTNFLALLRLAWLAWLTIAGQRNRFERRHGCRVVRHGGNYAIMKGCGHCGREVYAVRGFEPKSNRDVMCTCAMYCVLEQECVCINEHCVRLSTCAMDVD